MNYAYLFVDNLGGHSYQNGLDELKASVFSLKKMQNYDSIHVFNNETSGKNIEYFENENIIHNRINLSRNYGGSNNINPINILVEKIICLMNFDEGEDITLIDIDTEFQKQILNVFWNPNYVVFDNVEYPIMQWRNLDKILPSIPWKTFDINFDSSFLMYNTGVIHLPKKFRKELCEKALGIVDYLNHNFSPEDRCGNKLDEQIALSIVCHDTYGRFGNIKYSKEYIHHHWESKQTGEKWWEKFNLNSIQDTEDIILKPENNSVKLPLSVGILSWNSHETLRNTLESYRLNGLFDLVNDVTLFFQECSEEDIEIANEYQIPFIAFEENIGIGRAFIKLCQIARTENILLLEHDWELIENKNITFERLKSGIEMLDQGYVYIRYRHRENPGYPLYSKDAYIGNELNHYDNITDSISPHLIECCHWIEHPDLQFPDKIQKVNDYYTTTSKWGCFTNNPCMYKKDFYLNKISPFAKKSLLLENDVIYWWIRQDFKVAFSKGLFTHNDIEKYGPNTAV
jgi:hypothetical protein